MKQLIEEAYLYEGLIYTHEIEQSVDYLNRAKSVATIGFRKTQNRIMMVTNDIDEKTFDWVLKMTNTLGWYPTSYKGDVYNPMADYHPYTDNKKLEFIQFVKSNAPATTSLWFDAKFDRQISSDDLPQYGYHVTPRKNEDKILKIGLAPKSKEKFGKQKDRIYILFDKADANYLINHNKFYPDQKEFVVFKINFQSLNRNRKIRYFEDPAFPESGFYTYENIPPQYLVVDEFLKRK